jgi:hypothetical protein
VTKDGLRVEFFMLGPRRQSQLLEWGWRKRGVKRFEEVSFESDCIGLVAESEALKSPGIAEMKVWTTSIVSPCNLNS